MGHSSSTSRKILIILLAVFGIGCLFIALAANRLGLDHNVTWGTKRILLAVIGAGSLLVLVELIFQARLRPVWHKLAQVYEAFAHWVENRRVVRWSKKMMERIWTWPVMQALFGSPLKRLVWGTGIILLVATGWYVTLYLDNATARDG
ncbi:MAG TPA: hypothetical protein VMC62_08330, partial [Longilinea sp.]|nr:hypothetical protein [Longilinea sp.]